MDKAGDREIKLFGLALTIVLSLICIKAYKTGNPYSAYLLLAALIVFILVLAKVRLIYPLYRFLKIIGTFIGWLLSSIILTIIFYLVVTPLGLLARLVNRDFLGVGKSNLQSYWVEKKEVFSKEGYKHQF